MSVSKKIILCVAIVAWFNITNVYSQANPYRIDERGFCLDLFSFDDYVPTKFFDWTHNAFEWVFGIKKKLRDNLPAFIENPYKNDIASVRIGPGLCNQELAYLKKRKAKVKQTLEKILDHPLEDHEIPKIAFVCSGGGYRALIAALGFFIGAEKNGFFDAVTYMTGVSGSTWMIGTWLNSGLSLVDFKESLVEKLCKGLTHVGPKGALLMADMLLVKYAADQPITLVDFYGALLGHALFRDMKEKRHQVYLSQQGEIIKEGEYPFPIYTAVRGDEGAPMNWYEFTPYEIGADWLNAYIPSWAYGREFRNGISIDYDPEQSLGYHFGVFGSAFSASFSRIYSEFKENIRFDLTKRIIEKILEDVGNKRLTTANAYNFTYGMESSPIKDQKELNLMDGGIAINLAYQPVSGKRPDRKADVLVFLDSSSDITISSSLKCIERYAQEHNLPFPKINYTDIDTKVATVFVDNENPQAPIVVYMPLINDLELWQQHKEDPEFAGFDQYLKDFDPIACINGSYCSTFDFSYEEFELRQLSALTEFNMRAAHQVIYDAIALAVERCSVS